MTLRWLAVCKIRRAVQRSVFPSRYHYLCAALVFTGLAVYGSLVPFRYTPTDVDAAWLRFQRLQYLQLGIQSRSDWVANILLFIPVGFLFAGALLADSRSSVRKLLGAPGVVAGCAALSMAIEFTQLWFPPRTVSQNDIIAESIGGAIGTVAWLVAGQRATASLRSFMSMTRPADQFDWLLRAYLGGVLIYSVLPFDLTIRVSELWDKYQEGKITLIPFTYPYGSTYRAIYAVAASMLMFVPVGMLIARSLATGSGRGRSLAVCAFWGLLLAAAVEGAQLFVYSRTTNTTDVITGTLGAIAGAWMLARWAPSAATSSPPFRSSRACVVYLGLALLTIAVLPLVFWAPYDFMTDSEFIRSRVKGLVRAPFGAMYFGTDFNAMVQMTRKTLWYVPLGAFLLGAVRTSGVSAVIRRYLSAAVLPAVAAVAVFIELGKVLVPIRTPDLTNVLLATAGGLAGMFLAKRLIPAADDWPSSVVEHRSSIDHRHPTIDDGRSTIADRYIPGLDGLRAIACLAVFGVHFHQLTGIDGAFGPFEVSRFFTNGNHGVAVFFVMSGFLLGLPWWHGAEPSGNPAWLRRYGFKRIARITPPYFLCLTVLVLKGRHWETAAERLDTVLHYLFVHNFAEFSIYSLNSPFWTLAVQAQFYVIFPIALLLIHRAAATREGRLRLWVALLAGSFAVHYGVMTLSGSRDGYVLSHSLLAHLPHFFLGVAAGYLFWRLSAGSSRDGGNNRTACEVAFWTSALIVLFVVATPLDQFTQIPFGRYHFPLVPGLIALMIACVSSTRWARRLLETAPLRLLGVMSFGVYIYHLPALNLVARAMAAAGREAGEHRLLFGVVGLAASIGVATVSYVVIERPLLRLSKGQSSAQRRGSAEAARSAQWATTY